MKICLKPLALLGLGLLTSACLHDNKDNDREAEAHSGNGLAIVTTVASDYSSGAHSAISLHDEPRKVSNNLVPAGSDLTAKAFGENFYRIARFNADNITKFHVTAPDKPIWQFSTQDAGDSTSRNPHDLVFANANEAYVLRYGSPTAWIVNPGVSDEANFKVGELDLSAYDDGDGIPEMDQGLIVKNKLFITMQRLDRNNGFTPGDAYVAVFDLTDQTEIDTGKGQNGLKGILLPIRNPGKIVYSAATGLIYVQGIGSYAADTFNGGIATIDPDTYEVKLLVDDQSTTDGGVGKIANMVIVSASKGYLVGYAGFGDNTLYQFDPSTGAIDPTPVAGQNNKNIADIERGGHDKLWLSDQSNAEVVIIDMENNQVEERIDTELNPNQIVFVGTP